VIQSENKQNEKIMHHHSVRQGSAQSFARKGPIFALFAQGSLPQPLRHAGQSTTIHEMFLSNLNPMGEIVTIFILPSKALMTQDHVACIFVDDLVQEKADFKGTHT